MTKKEEISTIKNSLEVDKQNEIAKISSEEQTKAYSSQALKVIQLVKELTGSGLKYVGSVDSSKNESKGFTIGVRDSIKPTEKSKRIEQSFISNKTLKTNATIKATRIHAIKARYALRFPNPKSLDIIANFLYALEINQIIRRKSVGTTLVKQEDSGNEVPNVTVLNHTNKDILSIIKDHFLENKYILIDNALPLVASERFIDLIIEERIPFSSIENKEVCDLFSKTLLYVSNKDQLWRGGNRNAGKNTKEPADQFARKVGPVLDGIDSKKYKTLRAKAQYLNDKEIKTIRNKEWTAIGVSNLLNRWKKLQAEEENPKSTKSPQP